MKGMRLLFYRYGSICEPGVIRGFEELGLEIVEIDEEVHNKSLLPSQCVELLNKCLTQQPVDFVFSINFFPIVAEVCQIYHLRYLCWVVDSPVMELYTRSIEKDTNRIFLFDRQLYREIEPLNSGHVFHLPLAANVQQMDPVIKHANVEQRSKFRTDISFVGSLYTEKCAYDRLEHPSAYLKGYLDGLMEAQLKIYGYYFIEELLTDDIIKEFKDHFEHFYQLPGESYLTDRITLSQLYIGTKVSVMERDRVMKLLSEKYPVTIYTGSDTAKYPKLDNRGFVKTLTEMPLVFHESKINLNITSKPIRAGLPLRIWDILGSGGFCLTNYQEELPELLPTGEYLDCYGSLEELDEKVSYYLEHEKVRKEIARHGYEQVKQYHTYPVRLEKMLKLAWGLEEQ